MRGQIAVYGIRSDDKPVLCLVKPGTELEIILSDDKRGIAAVLIPTPIQIHQIENLYAMFRARPLEDKRLARKWKMWAVLCEPAWANRQRLSPSARPEGAKFFFAS